MLCPVPHVFASGTQNGQDAPKASPIDLVGSRTDRAAPTSLLDDVRFAAHRRSREGRLLI
jgi:hypothetical protein